MTEPCDKGPDIEQLKVDQAEIKTEQVSQGIKLDQVLDNQQQLGTDFKDALSRLTSIIEEEIGTRKDVEQLKKDREILYEKRGVDAARIAAIEVRNAKCDGLGVFEKFPMVWDFMQQEKGWRRFVPGVGAAVCTVSVVYTTWFSGG